MTPGRVGTESAAGLFLAVVVLAALGHVRDGTLGTWLGAKFLSRNEVAPPGGAAAPTAAGLPPPGGASGGTAEFGDPVPSATFISGFGAPRDGGKRTHMGVDLGAPRGTPVVAVANGTVAYAVNSGLCGKGVGIDHPGGVWRSVYCHLDTIGVAKGGTILRGQVVGTVGNTGNAATTGPHLHFELRRNGVSVNPRALIGR